MKHRHLTRPVSRWTPRKFLRAAEESSNSLRKRLLEVCAKATGYAGSMDDAIALALLIEQLARKGRNASADEATEIAEKIDLLVDLLWTEIDELFAS